MTSILNTDEGQNKTGALTEDSASNRSKTLEDYIIMEFVKKVRTYFDLKHAMKSQSNNFLANLKKVIQTNFSTQQSSEVDYPVAQVKLTSLDFSNEGTYNVHALRRMRVYGKLNDTESARRAYSIKPSVFIFDLIFYSQSFDELMFIANKWNFAVGASPDLNFTIAVDGKEFDIKTILENNLAFPEKDMDPNSRNVYEMTGSVRVAGYMSNAGGLDSAKPYPVLNSLSVIYYNGLDPRPASEQTPLAEETIEVGGPENE